MKERFLRFEPKPRRPSREDVRLPEEALRQPGGKKMRGKARPEEEGEHEMVVDEPEERGAGRGGLDILDWKERGRGYRGNGEVTLLFPFVLGRSGGAISRKRKTSRGGEIHAAVAYHGGREKKRRFKT